MTDQVAIVLPRPRVNEGSAFNATAYFRDSATKAASAPGAASYRVDCLTTRQTLQDWTELTPAASIVIALAATMSAIQNQCNPREVKRVTVAAEPDETSQVLGSAIWTVENLGLSQGAAAVSAGSGGGGGWGAWP